MISTPRTNVGVCIEATASNLQWFKDACEFSWSTKKRKQDEFDFPVALDSICKVMRNDDEMLRLCCNYRKEDGKWTKFARSIDKREYDTTDELNGAVSELVKRVKTFHVEHHHPSDAADVEEDHDDQIGEHD
jgi:hypothetical protein